MTASQLAYKPLSLVFIALKTKFWLLDSLAFVMSILHTVVFRNCCGYVSSLFLLFFFNLNIASFTKTNKKGLLLKSISSGNNQTCAEIKKKNSSEHFLKITKFIIPLTKAGKQNQPQ